MCFWRKLCNVISTNAKQIWRHKTDSHTRETTWDVPFIPLKTCAFLRDERLGGLVVALSVTSSTVLKERSIHLLSDMPSSRSCSESGHFSSVKKDSNEKSPDLWCDGTGRDKHFIMIPSHDPTAVSNAQHIHCMQTAKDKVKRAVSVYTFRSHVLYVWTNVTSEWWSTRVMYVYALQMH